MNETNNRNFNPKNSSEPGLTKEQFLTFYDDFENGLTMIVDKDHYEALENDDKAQCSVLRTILNEDFAGKSKLSGYVKRLAKEVLGEKTGCEDSVIVGKKHYDALVDILKLCYRKLHSDDLDVGSEELSNVLCDALCEAMTDKGFQKWLIEQQQPDCKTCMRDCIKGSLWHTDCMSGKYVYYQEQVKRLGSGN